MKRFAWLGVSLLVAVLTSPALAQPFADTPTNHWAYDAIAELAAKGLIEGYPDGTFKGDRAMTRYEMAMVVARLLARIESIQIPTPQAAPQPCRSGAVSNPSPQASTQPQAQAQPAPAPAGPPCYVTRADIDMILRLVNEFRAELAAKNVRLTAVEEELNAIKAQLSNVRITGGYRFRYDMSQEVAKPSTPIPGNNNPNTSVTPVTRNPRGNRARQEFKLGADGSIAPGIHLILGLETANNFQVFDSSAYGFGTGLPASSQPATGACCSINSLFLDWRPGWVPGLALRLGRFGNDTPCGGGCYPIQFGPFGLLMNDASEIWEDSVGLSEVAVADGLWMMYYNESLARLTFQGVWLRIIGNVGALTYPSGEDAYGFDANVRLFPGFRLGAYYVGNTISQAGGAPFTGPSPFGVLYHLYSAGGSLNPGVVGGAFTSGAGGLRCLVSATGINCPALGNGWGAYVQWDVMPGIHLDVEAAQWSDTTPNGGTDSGAIAAATWNLSTIFHICCRLTVVTGYEYYGPNFYSPYGSADADQVLVCDCEDIIYPGNTQGVWVNASIQPWQGWTFYANYLTGNHVSNSQPLSELAVGIRYAFAPNASITVKYRDVVVSGIDQRSLYRAQIDYSF